MNTQLPTIYPITNAAISGLSIVQQVEKFIEGGAEFIQIREKHAASRDFLEQAKAAVDIARRHSVRVIVNDRVDIAMLANADGVHLGQEDIPPESARRLLGEDAIIGFSTHTLDQVRAAVMMPVDYIAFGPVFRTSTKVDPDPVVGLETLREVKFIVGRLPLVAIGGIGEDNLSDVLRAGADCAAIIGGILKAQDGIAAAVRRLSNIT